MKKITLICLLLCLGVCNTVGAATQQNIKPKALVIRPQGQQSRGAFALNDEQAREAADKKKIVTDRNLKIVADLLFDKTAIWHLPMDYKSTTILGEAVVSKAQAVSLLKRYNMALPIDVTAETIVRLYEEEATLEGVKWDVAFCQALVETGFFNFGGTVVPEQNNFCGLGTTSAYVRGAYFLTPREGVRAHIQHLLAYSTARKPRTEIIDPRYYLVYNNKIKDGFFTYWSELNGKWATGSDYAEKILNIHQQMQHTLAIMPDVE